MRVTERSSTRDTTKPIGEKYGDTWLKESWRPMMAMTYMFICLYDFVIADALRLYLLSHGIVDPTLLTAWTAQTLTNGGMFHFAMGAILGATAWTRGQEKIRRVENYNYNDPFSDPFFNSNSSYGRRPSLSQEDILNDPSVIPPQTGN